MIDYISPFAEEFPSFPNVLGVRIATAHSGMRYQDRDDLTLVELAEGTTVAGVLTKNNITGEPVKWCREILPAGKARALIVNAGIANVLTGKDGAVTVSKTAEAVAAKLGIKKEEVFVSSTGVIGEKVPEDKIIDKLDELHSGLSDNNWHQAALAIKTTDTFAKGVSRKAFVGSEEVTINGIIKGSGMVAPNMATMLGYVFTDAKIPAKVLQDLINKDTQLSYNSITVDSDTSTSDTVLVFATGQKDHWEITDAESPELQDFREKLREVHIEMAKLVVKDGEGITKFVTINVDGASSEESARKIGMSIANSPLVKTAITGEDPNWGRIAMAIGKCGEEINREKTSIKIGDYIIAENDEVHPDYVEKDVANYMKNKELSISVDVGVGQAKSTVWTMDLTNDYIRINTDYRS